MKFGKRARIGVIMTMLAGIIFGMSTPSQAGPSGASTPLIDKEFETALRKFVAKRFFNRIDASDEQREKISKIMSDTQEATRPDREEFRQRILNLSSLMSSKDATDDEIKAKVSEMRALKEKIQDRRLAAALEVRKVLTQEQRQQIHNRVTEIISGGLKPRRISMLLSEGILSNEN